MIRTIHLHGALKEQFGESFRFDVVSAAQAFSAILRQVKGFKEAILPNQYHVFLGDPKDNFSIGAEELNFNIGKHRDIHVVPAVYGAGGRGGGVAKVILGTIISVAGFATGNIGLVLAGAGLFLQGSAVLLTPVEKVNNDTYNNREEANNRTSYLFSGPVNTTQQGLPVPLIYGRMRVGSQVISSGIQTQALA